MRETLATFVIEGQPVPQPRSRVVNVRGRPMSFVPRSHPIHAYRQSVALIATAAGLRASGGPLVLHVEFVIARPPSHWGKAGLRSAAPEYPPRCDWDNLVKGVQDALKGIAFHDDDQVVFGSGYKRYAERDERACTVVTIGRL